MKVGKCYFFLKTLLVLSYLKILNNVPVSNIPVLNKYFLSLSFADLIYYMSAHCTCTHVWLLLWWKGVSPTLD